MTASQTLIDWTNQRDDDAAENTSITTAAVEGACAEIKGILGSSVDSTEAIAVDYGARMSQLRLANWWNVGWSERGDTNYRQLLNALVREADARRQGKHTQLRTPSTMNLDDLDAAYPDTPPWFDGDSSSTGIPSDEDT